MAGQKKSKKQDNHLSVDMTKSEMSPARDTNTDIMKKSVKMMQHFEMENYKKDREIQLFRKAQYYTKIGLDKVKEENEKLKARNQLLEKNNGSKQIQNLHNELKKEHLTENLKKQIDAEYDEKEREFFKSQGILEYMENPNVSSKKKQK